MAAFVIPGLGEMEWSPARRFSMTRTMKRNPQRLDTVEFVQKACSAASGKTPFLSNASR